MLKRNWKDSEKISMLNIRVSVLMIELQRTGSGRFGKENGNGCGKHLFPKERGKQSDLQEWNYLFYAEEVHLLCL